MGKKRAGDREALMGARHAQAPLASVSAARRWRRPAGDWLISSLIVVAGVFIAREIHDFRPIEWNWQWFARFDGMYYAGISTGGYTYNPERGSSVAFFPAYPLAGRSVMGTIGLDGVPALIVVSWIGLLATFVALAAYLQNRGGTLGDVQRDTVKSNRTNQLALLAFGLVPTTFFFRMAYSESLFLAAVILSMYGMLRRWPLAAIAFFVGLATATRSVGVALIPPLVLHVWQVSASWRARLARLSFVLPLSLWGLMAYMVYLQVEFGDALAFATTQAKWRIGQPPTGIDKLWTLVTLQPIWRVYDRSYAGYWASHGSANPLLNLQFANPIYFVGTAVLVSVGAWKRWLTAGEVLLAVGLLAIPYVTRSAEMCLLSHGRFAAAVFPAYIVLGQLLARVPALVAGVILLASAALMATYAGIFAIGEWPFI